MADHKDVGAPALDTNIESGNFDEKKTQQAAHADAPPPKEVAASDEEEDEDMDALIEDLESEDGHAGDEEEEEEGTPGGGRTVPEDMLQTDSRVGLTESEVTTRRRKYGLNQMKEEKENLILKFLGYFVGPIQFVMEVSFLLFHLSSLVCPWIHFHFTFPLINSSAALCTSKTHAAAISNEFPCFGRAQWLALRVLLAGAFGALFCVSRPLFWPSRPDWEYRRARPLSFFFLLRAFFFRRRLADST